jgi:hypothetical protein
MNKLALAAAALLPLVSGCVSSTCDYPTVTIDWALQDVNGVRWDCGSAAVAYVDVYFDGTSWSARYDCSAGGALIDVSGFAPGVYPVTIEGIGSDQSTIYDRAQFDVTVHECGGSAYYPVLGEAMLEIDYHFSPDVCHGGYMWYALYDEVAGQYLSAVYFDTQPDTWKDYYGCYSATGGTPLSFPVPFGRYTLAWIQEVMNPLAAFEVDVNPVQQACVQPPVDVTGPGITYYPVTLVDNTVTPTSCPVYP